MKLPRRNFLQLAAGASALPAVSPITRAQAYPTRPVTMVVTFPAGSGVRKQTPVTGVSPFRKVGLSVTASELLADVDGSNQHPAPP